MKKWVTRYLLILLATVQPVWVFAQQWQASCNLQPGHPVTATLVSSSGSPLDSIESGKDFNLNITLPGLGNQNCSGYVVQIQTSNNITLGTQPASTPYPFGQTSSNPPVFSNPSPIPTTNGYGLNIPFHFLPGTTCNGELGTFKIIIKTTCGNKTDSCVLNVSLKAIAKNYWKVSKQRVWGNLSGGYVLWRIVIQNTNPNPGIGDLNIYSGTITDQITGSNIISSVPGISVTGLGTSTASWNTGTISVYNTYVIYDVWTKMCDPAGTLVQNCVNYSFCLGKPTISTGPANPNPANPSAREITQPDSTNTLARPLPTSPAGGPILIPPKSFCCASATGQACDTVTLVKEPNYGVCFSKFRPNANYINWAQGCEGLYVIRACGNCGSNVPLDSLVIRDTFPAGIQVTSITVSSPVSGQLQVGSSTFPFSGGSQTYTFSSPPSGFVFSTTPGQVITNQCVDITVKFTITAPAGTLIQNCAHLNYTNASFSDTVNACGVPIPGGQYHGAATACDTFYVRPPQAIPFIKKCIRNGQSSFNVGDVIPFQIVIINHGQAPLGPVNVQDFLGSPQNLQLVPGSIHYQHGMGAFNIYYPWTCSPSWSQPDTTQPSWVNYTGSGNQNLSWTINGMPGSCYLDSAYYLVIQFDAVVLPQSFGNDTNTATLTGSGWNISSGVPYNVMRLAKIDVSKKVGVNGQWGTTGFVNPGQIFQYQISLCNVGSVALNNLQVWDALPGCVQLQGCSGYILTAQGQQQPISGISCSAPNFNFPASATIQPGECAVLILNVKRNPQDTSAQCCNPLARGKGTTTDAVHQTIQDEDGPVCVKNSLCCELEKLQWQLQPMGFTTTQANFDLYLAAGNLPIQEVNISLMDYHVQYSYSDCKPPSLGDSVMHLTSSLTSLNGSAGGPLVLQNPNPPFVNQQLQWSLGNPVMLASGVHIPISLVFPSVLQIPCCTSRVYFCLLVEVKDVECRICQKTVCGYFNIPQKK
ncbi:hypothetical protein [Thermoflavifilum thermophilum]|uniref:Conserved repeat domain-containing protein n=1 Tax=Thermoflavifilum thermophilum TaxID=1393122 RepID=A0A1I7NE00_9BACT|nr:hypothetical protein [Thermoflavifilum thermophilum]SFV32793.1 conserved repeat domain-containing protein [Thermoflavifilum thermophilum]